MLSTILSGIPTNKRFDTHSSTCVDVSFCIISLLKRYIWERSTFLCGFDHHPIIIAFLCANPLQSSYRKLTYDCADCSLFRQITKKHFLSSKDLFLSPVEAFLPYLPPPLPFPLSYNPLQVFFDLEKIYDFSQRIGILLKPHSLGLRGQSSHFLSNLMPIHQIILTEKQLCLSRHLLWKKKFYKTASLE